MIWTSDNEFLLDDYHNRSLLKKLPFSGASPENFEYCRWYSICEHTIIDYAQFHQKIPDFMGKHLSVQESRCFEFSEHFTKTMVQIEIAVNPERMGIFP